MHERFHRKHSLENKSQTSLLLQRRPERIELCCVKVRSGCENIRIYRHRRNRDGRYLSILSKCQYHSYNMSTCWKLYHSECNWGLLTFHAHCGTIYWRIFQTRLKRNKMYKNMYRTCMAIYTYIDCSHCFIEIHVYFSKCYLGTMWQINL